MRFPHLPGVRRGRTSAVVLSALLTLPTLAAAQAVNSADLVGMWAEDSAKTMGWTFRADSTVSIVERIPQGPLTASGRWQVTGDTLKVHIGSAKLDGQWVQVRIADRKVEVSKDKLTLTRLDTHKTTTYDKVDSLVSEAPAQVVAGRSRLKDSTTAAQACTVLQAYVQQVAKDSIRVLRKNGKLSQVIADVQRTGQLQINIPEDAPDTIRSLVLRADPSCSPIDEPTILKLLQATAADTAADTASKLRQP